MFEIVAPDGVLLDYATAHQEYVADEAAMWQRFYNGLLLMTLPFSLLGVLAYWAVGGRLLTEIFQVASWLLEAT